MYLYGYANIKLLVSIADAIVVVVVDVVADVVFLVVELNFV